MTRRHLGSCKTLCARSDSTLEIRDHGAVFAPAPLDGWRKQPSLRQQRKCAVCFCQMCAKRLCFVPMRTSKLKFLLLLITMLGSTSLCAAEVWKWVDKNGVTHYSDQPVPGAVKINLQNAQTYKADDAAIPESTQPPPRPSTAPTPYVSIGISAPTNEQTFTGTGGQVSVSVQLEPGLQAGDSVQLMMNGQVVSEPSSSATSFELKDVPRGTHTLLASVIGRDGQIVIQSPPVTFFMRQQSVLQKR